MLATVYRISRLTKHVAASNDRKSGSDRRLWAPAARVKSRMQFLYGRMGWRMNRQRVCFLRRLVFCCCALTVLSFAALFPGQARAADFAIFGGSGGGGGSDNVFLGGQGGAGSSFSDPGMS